MLQQRMGKHAAACRHILTISRTGDVRVHGYDGNQLGAWQLPNLFPAHPDTVSLSNDTLAFLDSNQPKGQPGRQYMCCSCVLFPHVR